jgi:hypothetical protein
VADGKYGFDTEGSTIVGSSFLQESTERCFTVGLTGFLGAFGRLEMLTDGNTFAGTDCVSLAEAT